jgi:hypothetical protein
MGLHLGYRAHSVAAGSIPTWPYSRGWGYYPSGGLGLVVLIFDYPVADGSLVRDPREHVSNSQIESTSDNAIRSGRVNTPCRGAESSSIVHTLPVVFTRNIHPLVAAPSGRQRD